MKTKNSIRATLTVVLIVFCMNFYSQTDKPLDFLINSHAVPLMGITMRQAYDFSEAESIAIPSAVMAIVDISKEIIDKNRGGIFSTDDLIADAKGLVTGAFITLVVNGLIRHIKEKRDIERASKFFNPVNF